MRVLIIGGGIGGLTAAVSLARHGLDVELVETQPELRASGAGLTLLNPTLRALEQLDLLAPVMDAGCPMDEVLICNAEGVVIDRSATREESAPDRPGNVGILRHRLRGVLHGAAVAAGARVRLGTSATLTAWDDDAARARIGGTEERYDLIVGADGIHSPTRAALFPEAPAPEFQHQAVWRATLPRPPEITTYSLLFGPRTKAGVNPMSATELYLLLVESVEDDTWPEPETRPARLRALLEDFGGPVALIRDAITDPEAIDYRPIETGLVPRPWYRGRALLIGDAAHAPTPQLASGAGMAIEDGIVLGEELGSGGVVEAALERFVERRWERCRMVVENSLQLSRWDRDPSAPGADPRGLTHESHALLAQPF